jgi:hypothetical protein
MTDVPTILPSSKPRHHKWDAQAITRIPANESDNGCEQTHRSCVLCGTVKVTMHPPAPAFPWLEFILPGKPMRFRMDRTPVCEPKGDVEDIR